MGGAAWTTSSNPNGRLLAAPPRSNQGACTLSACSLGISMAICSLCRCYVCDSFMLPFQLYATSTDWHLLCGRHSAPSSYTAQTMLLQDGSLSYDSARSPWPSPDELSHNLEVAHALPGDLLHLPWGS